MLTEKEIRAAIVQRLIVADDSCSGTHLAAIHQQIRALCFVLGHGEAPLSVSCRTSAIEICQEAGIPITDNGDGTVEWPEWWLVDHGFYVDGDEVEHALGSGW